VDRDDPIRWGILGTAGIARTAFLPALREAGGGVAVGVAGRDPGRTRAWAAEHDAGRPVEGYGSLLADAEIEAVYIALPNALHAEWTIAALEAGKAVLCEKPLCGNPADTERVLAVARATPRPLWEAFVFPFHAQMARVRDLLSEGAVGDVREIRSAFHFVLEDPDDIRLSAQLEGGSVQDVGCYPIRLARLLFGTEPLATGVIADAVWTHDGVDRELWGALAFPGERRLVLSCGFRAGHDTTTTILGTLGRIEMTNPFHPVPGDRLAVADDAGGRTEPAPGVRERSFTPALRHINRALRGLEPARHLATDDALGNSLAIAALLANASAGHGAPGDR
jgi:predicted dehydrogenase